MFIVHMPKTFRIGDTAGVLINAKPARITWRDANTLVIEPDDARTIVAREEDNEMACFMCGNAGETRSDYETDADPAYGGGFVVFKKP